LSDAAFWALSRAELQALLERHHERRREADHRAAMAAIVTAKLLAGQAVSLATYFPSLGRVEPQTPAEQMELVGTLAAAGFGEELLGGTFTEADRAFLERLDAAGGR